MDTIDGYRNSFAGFVDYSRCFGEYDVVWTITGFLIMVGTVISYQPQNIKFILHKSSYGFDPIMAFVTNLGQSLVFFNLISFHCADFTGLFQVKVGDMFYKVKVMATFLTVVNMALDWYTYKFVFILNYIFVDIEERPKRGLKLIRKEKLMGRLFVIIQTIIEFVIFTAYVGIGVSYGFGSQVMRTFGQIMGYISSVVFVFQFIPQMVMTCRLEDNGEFSIITLLILFFGTSINLAFMVVGQGEDWTSWLPVTVTICEQFVLLMIIIYVKIKQYNRKKGQIVDSSRDLATQISSSEDSRDTQIPRYTDNKVQEEKESSDDL